MKYLSFSRRLFRLLEDPVSKKWNNKEITMCGSDYCTPPLSNDYATSIISFGEDEQGKPWNVLHLEIYFRMALDLTIVKSFSCSKHSVIYNVFQYKNLEWTCNSNQQKWNKSWKLTLSQMLSVVMFNYAYVMCFRRSVHVVDQLCQYSSLPGNYIQICRST